MTLTEEFKERGNETLCTTSWGALRYYFFRLDQHFDAGTLAAADKEIRPLIIGLRLDAKDFLRSWMTGDFNFSKFNRWYTDYFVTHYGPLRLTANTLQAALELEAPFNYSTWKTVTVDYFCFQQLVWDGSTPIPHWLSAAQGDFGDFNSSSGTPAEDSEETGMVTRKTAETAKAGTSTASSFPSTLVEQALAQALLVLTKDKN